MGGALNCCGRILQNHAAPQLMLPPLQPIPTAYLNQHLFRTVRFIVAALLDK